MAINQGNKALNIATETVQATEKFMQAVDALQALENERTKSGITLGDYDAVFGSNEALKHVDGDSLTAVLGTSVPALVTWITTEFHLNNFQKIRP